MSNYQYYLDSGSHTHREQGMCAMEWVAYLAGERHSDWPECVDPVLRRFGIRMNDSLPDDLRQQLRPYLARMIGTADDGLSRRRAFMCADWAVREIAPVGLNALGRSDWAEQLRGLAPVVDEVTALVAAEAAEAARFFTFRIAATAARAAAGGAHHAAAHHAVAVAADTAAYVGWERILPSALDLLDRMLPTELIRLPVVADAAVALVG